MSSKVTKWQLTKAWTMGIVTLLVVPLATFAGAVYGNTRSEGGKGFVKELPQTVMKKKYPDDTVFLLHGLARNNQDMMSMQNEFVRRGFKTVNWSYPSDRYSVEQLGDQLADLVKTYNNKRIHFVGHSLGGLVTRAYMSKYHPKNVRHVVTIGTPHSGASLASMFGELKVFKTVFGPAGTDLMTANALGLPLALPVEFPHTDFATIIGASGNEAGMNPLIQGDNDGLVSVREAELPGAKASLVLKHSHLTIHFEKDTIQAAANFVEFDRLQP